jgi:outer membrane protein TolC
MKKLLLSLIISLQALMVLGQNEVPNKQNNWQEKFFQSSELVLPLLFDAAIKNSGQIESLELEREMALEDNRIIRKEIFTNVSIGTSYNYGTFVNLFALNQGEAFDPNLLGINAFKLPAAARHNTGITLALPVGQFLTRHHKIKKQELMHQQIMAENKTAEMEIRKMVISLYQDIVLAKAELELSQEAFQSASMLYELAEKQLMAGEIQLREMSAIQETYTKAAVAKETAQIKYETTFLYMEELVGMRIPDLLDTL